MASLLQAQGHASDTADGVFMVGAYGWAYVHPIRRLYYNMTITTVSIVFAVAIG
jgi:high-affinity nickel-transport protein